VQEQQATIATLEKANQEQQATIARLEARLAALETRLVGWAD